MSESIFRISLLLLLLGSSTAVAQIPRTIAYQGVLANKDGSFVPDGMHELGIALYNDPIRGYQLYREIDTVAVVRGVFNVIIGAKVPLPDTLSFDRAYFLGVSVDGNGESYPAVPVTSVPYAFRADTANHLHGNVIYNIKHIPLDSTQDNIVINDLDIGDAGIIKFAGFPKRSVTLNGIAGGRDGKIIQIYFHTNSPSMQYFGFINESNAAAPENRIRLGYADATSLNMGQTIQLIYDASIQRWIGVPNQ
jgi:hypothetical protein